MNRRQFGLLAAAATVPVPRARGAKPLKITKIQSIEVRDVPTGKGLILPWEGNSADTLAVNPIDRDSRQRSTLIAKRNHARDRDRSTGVVSRLSTVESRILADRVS